MKIKLVFFNLLTIVLLSSSAAIQGNGQEKKAVVNYVSAETSDGLLFSARISNENINYGRDIIVHYLIQNHSGRPVYIVHDKTSKTVVEEDSITFPEPFIPIGGHEDYNYGFLKVASNTNRRGQLKITKDEYRKAQFWSINVGFGYVTNINGLNPSPDQIRDPAPYKSLLNLRAKTVLLSSLSVDLKKIDN